jgi:hypothetical protein
VIVELGAMPLALAGVVACAACGGGSAQHRPDPDDQLPCEPGGAFDLNGRFALIATLNEEISVLGLELEDPNPQAEVFLMMDLVVDGTTVDANVRVCDITIPPVQLKGQPKPLQFVAPPELKAAEPWERVATTLSGTTTCSTFSTDAPLTVVLGTRLKDRLHDPLPVDPQTQGCDGDPLTPCDATEELGCICDYENDGQPGATLDVIDAPVLPDLDKIYVTQRLFLTLSGRVHGSDLLAGAATDSLEHGILDCHRLSGPCSAEAASVIQRINPTIEQDPRYPSTFIAKRIDATWDCLRLVSERNAVFPK